MLQPFKEGGAYIAIRAGVPIVPIVLVGTRQVLPFGGGVVQSGRVTLKILNPIDTAQLTLRNRGELTEKLHALIAAELGAGNSVRAANELSSSPS